MMSILQILEDIGSDSKRSHKLSLITQHQNNESFLKVVKLALDPYKNFFIRKIPAYVSRNTNVQTLDWALSELEKLSNRQHTGHAGIEHLRSVLGNVSADDAVVIERIIGKDLRCGIADGIVNAVLKDFIPTYPCLLARAYDEKNIKNITYPAYSQLKADGLRANVFVEDGKVTICGRSGREIDLLGALDAAMIELASKFPFAVVFDGELVVADQDNKIVDRKTGNGIITKAIKGTISEDEAKLVRLQMWDVIPVAEFKQGKASIKYKDRFESLIQAIDQDKPNTLSYWSIPFKVVDNLAQAEQHFEEMLSDGYEGTIIKNFDNLWSDTRSRDLVKMKAEKDCDLEITGWNPGTGQFEGQVGSLICASSDKKVEVSISGFSFELRKEITSNITNLIGKVVTVTYNERIKSRTRTDVDSLFLPRFGCFRTDKLVADSTNEIK